jgi:hypothetical protein
VSAKITNLYEVRPRKDKRGFDLISDALPFGRLVLLWSLRRGFVSRLNCILLGRVFALPRRAVKTRAFPVINTCLGVNPHLAMASARRGGIGRYLGGTPSGHWACSRARFLLSLRFLGSRFCFGRSRWRPGG